MSDDIPQLIKDMADALTSATEIQNRYWIAVAVTSLFVVVPQSSADSLLELPFGLPVVDGRWFGLLGVLVLSALLTAFASSEARLVRIQNLFFTVLENRRRHGHSIAGHDERDFLDAMRKPGLGTVAPLAHVVRGRFQFFRDADACPRKSLAASKSLYVFFKLPAMVVWIALPAAGLFFAMRRFLINGLPEGLPPAVAWLTWLLAAVAALSMLFVTWLEVHYLWIVLQRIWTKPSPL